MTQQTIRRILVLFALAPLSAAIAVAQTAVSPETDDIPVSTSGTWQVARSGVAFNGRLIVVTLDQPNRRQACRIRSFASEKLVCARAHGGARTFLPQQVVALILPGAGLSDRLVLGLGAVELGAAIWGNVVLVATCPACAVATGIVTFLWFGIGGASILGDQKPDRLLYLAPGQHLTGKLRSVQP